MALRRASVCAAVRALPPLEPSILAMVDTIGSIVAAIRARELPTVALTSTMKVKINRNGQITIPWILRAWMRTQPGDTFEIVQVGLQAWQIRPLVLRYPWGEVRRLKE